MKDLHHLKTAFDLTEFTLEKESTAYHACRFKLNGKQTIYRTAKITPKKIGQFVTLWIRAENGETRPFDLSDHIDLVIINCRDEDNWGQFIFPIHALLRNNIISESNSGGKRGFRLYLPWDVPTSLQAIKSQNWQTEHFISLPLKDKKSIDKLNSTINI